MNIPEDKVIEEFKYEAVKEYIENHKPGIVKEVDWTGSYLKTVSKMEQYHLLEQKLFEVIVNPQKPQLVMVSPDFSAHMGFLMVLDPSRSYKKDPGFTMGAYMYMGNLFGVPILMSPNSLDGLSMVLYDLSSDEVTGILVK